MDLNDLVDVTVVLLPRGDHVHLARSASDALAQRGVALEVLSFEPLAGMRDSRLRSVEPPATRTPAALCPGAVRAARGRWIAFFEAGDRWHPDRLRNMVDVADDRRASWVYGARVLLGPADQVVGLALAEDPHGVAARLRGSNVLGSPSCVVCRRELLTSAEPFDARLRALAFWRAWLTLAELAVPAAYPELIQAERVDWSELLRDPRRGLAELRLLNDEGTVGVDEAQMTLQVARQLRKHGRRRPAMAAFVMSALAHRRPQDVVRAVATIWNRQPSADGYARPAWLDDRDQPQTRIERQVSQARRNRPRALGRCEVSVVIPTRNRPRLLRQAVASALDQVDVDLEVIVVDDASDSPEAKSALRFEDPRVRVHGRPRPAGAGGARNVALALARGEWVAFLDDDDLFAPMRLRAHLDAAGAAGLGFCGQILVDPQRRPVGTLPAPPPDGLARRLRRSSSIGGPSAVVARTELVRRVGGFDEQYYALGDWHLWMRLAAHATAVAIPELLVAYTVHPSNMHRRAPDRVLADFSRFERIHDLDRGAEIGLVEWLADDLADAGRHDAAARLHLRLARRRRRAESAIRALQTIRARARPMPRTPHLIGPAWLRQYGAADAG